MNEPMSHEWVFWSEFIIILIISWVKSYKHYEGLVASAVLAWILSGTSTFENSFFTSVCLETHSIHWNIENVGQEAKILESVLNKFWSAENIEAKDNCVIRDSEEYIFHSRRRYMTKLLFRPIHEFLPDYFSVYEQRLKKLKNCLMSENLVEKYHEIF